jgi:uncharacterized coiled-coil protein SlyX
MKTKTSLTRNSMNRTPLRALLLIPLTLICFALSPQARAVCQEGCLRNDNTAIGKNALISTTGSQNTANGFQALFSNTIGNSNTAIGWEALTFNTTGNNNTATGTGSLQFNITGTENTATGVDALFSNTTGINNTANGAFALSSDTTGSDNTATGEEALEANTTGHDNTATGTNALLNNITGSSNIAIGSSAGLNLTTGSNNIDIGNAGVAAEANTIRVGTQGTQTKTFIAGVSGTAVTGSTVKVNSNGQIGVAPSSERFKEAIQPMDKTSEVILALHPVTFRYKKEIDSEGIPQFGLVAEEVEKVNPDLVARDDQGKPYTVRYEGVNAMLLNEFLKEHRKVEEQERAIDQLKATVAKQREAFGSKIAQQQKQIEALTATVQKVSAQIQMSKPAPQVAAYIH